MLCKELGIECIWPRIFSVYGIYEKETSEDSSIGIMGGFMPGADSSNQIYTSYETLKGIIENSKENADTETDSNGLVTTTEIRSNVKWNLCIFHSRCI